MSLTLTSETVVLDTLVKRHGKWHESETHVPSSALSGTTIGPLVAVKQIVVRSARVQFPGGTEVTFEMTPPVRCDRGSHVTIELSP